jgi:uncharacterized DUF497 family protein
MAIEFDPAKSEWNVRERGLPFSMVEDFDWDTAVTREDARSDYGEPRYVAIGYVEALVYVIVFTPRGEDTRVISFRRANDREIKAYEDARSVQNR